MRSRLRVGRDLDAAVYDNIGNRSLVLFDSGDARDIQDFVREHKIPYRQVLGDDKTQEAYDGTQGFPTTFVIDRQGMIRSKTIGSDPGKFARLQQTVDAALASP